MMRLSPTRSDTGTRRAIWLLAVLLAACTVSVTPEGQPEEPEPTPALPDGEMFAFVTVGADETGGTTFGLDLAEMLTGEEARLKAIDDGVITEDDVLPNDFYIANDEETVQLIQFADDATITVVSANDTSQRISIDEDQLAQLWNGEYSGEPVYGVVPGTPIAMDVTVENGLVAQLGAVYLP